MPFGLGASLAASALGGYAAQGGFDNWGGSFSGDSRTRAGGQGSSFADYDTFNPQNNSNSYASGSSFSAPKPKPPSFDFKVDLDSFFNPDSATSIADAILQQQYGSAMQPFQNNLARGVITPEAFELAKGNLNQQRDTLSGTYNQTALGELARGKTLLQDALRDYKADPTQLGVPAGPDFNAALSSSLQNRANTFTSGLNDSISGILGTQNPFQSGSAQRASLPGQGISGSNPIANVLANRGDSNQSTRKIGDRVV